MLKIYADFPAHYPKQTAKGVSKVEKLDLLTDSKKEIKFWLNALNQPHLDSETVELLNRCLRLEIQKFRISEIEREVDR